MRAKNPPRTSMYRPGKNLGVITFRRGADE
jgi:hypothetical protein